MLIVIGVVLLLAAYLLLWCIFRPPRPLRLGLLGRRVAEHGSGASVKRRLLGEHFKRDGKPKRGFATHAQALVEMERSNKAHAYRCKFCRQWHVAGRR
jgi:hypothetical protein